MPKSDNCMVALTESDRLHRLARPYSLTLTYGERSAFDWVGHRYSNGDAMSAVLCQYLPVDAEWSSKDDITFDLPEHAAWEIAELAQEDDDSFPCFAESLTLKMLRFMEAIV